MNKKGRVGTLVIIAIVFVALWGASNLSSLYGVLNTVFNVIAPVLAGFSIAFILNIPLRFLERLWIKWFTAKHRGLRRAVCILLCILGFIGIAALLLWFILPQIYETVKDKIFGSQNISKYIDLARTVYEKAAQWLLHFTIKLPPFEDISAASIRDRLMEYLAKEAGTLIGHSVNIVSAVFSFIFDAVLAVAISIYVLAKKESLGRTARKLLYGFLTEKNAERALAVARLTEKTFSKFVTGQVIEAVILASLCFVGMLIFRMPYPLVISVTMGVTALIPVFGAFIGAGIGAVLIFVDSPIKAIWFIIFTIVLQQLEGNLIYPRVVGTHIGLPGLWVLVAVTIGSEFGILGMLIAVPVSSLIYTMGRQIVNAILKKKGLDGMFEEEEPKEKKPKRQWFKRKNKNKNNIAPEAEDFSGVDLYGDDGDHEETTGSEK